MQFWLLKFSKNPKEINSLFSYLPCCMWAINTSVYTTACNVHLKNLYFNHLLLLDLYLYSGGDFWFCFFHKRITFMNNFRRQKNHSANIFCFLCTYHFASYVRGFWDEKDIASALHMLYLLMGRMGVGWELDKYSNDSAPGRVS